MINLLNLSMRFGEKILFKDVNFQFNPGHRYGLVGANGSGKSTFLKILTDEISPESGTINRPAQFLLGALKQDHYLYENEEILQVVLRGRTKLWQALEEQKQLLQKVHFTDTEIERWGQLEKVIAEQEGYVAASEAAKLLEGLGIRGELHSKPLHILSGGYKLRVLLAQVFFSQPDLLVLDEPTNHLDLFSIKWLEGYLRQYAGTLIVSSHDRDFLNGICTHIVDVDYGTMKVYKGNYDAFMAMKAQDKVQKEALLVKYDKRRTDIQGFIDRFGAKATKARQAQSKARLVDQLVEEMDALDIRPSSRLYPKLRFSPLRPSGKIALTVKNIKKSFNSKEVLGGISFEIERGDRLAIVGPNGIGKSTLLEILTDHLLADEGGFQWGAAARLAYFPQDHKREVQGESSLLDWLGRVDRDIPEEQLRGVLGQVLFSGDKVKQSISTLSGGETARLILAKMMLQKPNMLIFDEPTNHLDMEAIEELSSVLQEFDGTILLVSHNRYFVSRLANRILEISWEGIRDFRGSYPEYIEKWERDHLSISLKQRHTQESQGDAKEGGSTYEEQKKSRNAKSHLKKQIAKIEEECHLLEVKLKELENLMASATYYQTTSREEQQKHVQERAKLEKDLGEIMEQWEQVCKLL